MTDIAELAARATRFRELHASGCFLIANAWDGGSARVLQARGCVALATSSAAAAATLGRRDGRLGRDEALAHARLVASCTELPVSADLENGFGHAPEQVAETVRLAAAAGLAGCSIEDASGDPAAPLYPLEHATARIAAAVQAARALPRPFVLTARAEAFLHGCADLDAVIARLRAYAAAGAEVLFAPGLPDLDAVRRVCAEVGRPVNFMAGMPGQGWTLAELAAAGVRRVSLATSLYRAAMGAVSEAVQEILGQGSFGYLDRALPGRELHALLRD